MRDLNSSEQEELKKLEEAILNAGELLIAYAILLESINDLSNAQETAQVFELNCEQSLKPPFQA